MLSALSNLSTGEISHHLPCLVFSPIWQSFPENAYQLRSHRQEGAGKIYPACDSTPAWLEMGTQLQGWNQTLISSVQPPADTLGSLPLLWEQSPAKWARGSSWGRHLPWLLSLLAAAAQQAFTASGFWAGISAQHWGVAVTGANPSEGRLETFYTPLSCMQSMHGDTSGISDGSVNV